MTVHVAVHTDWGEHWILGVYSTRELAEARISTEPHGKVEEWEVDPV